jgi:hypothetical protein
MIMNRVEQSRQQRRSMALYAFILFVLLLAQGLSREALAQNQWETNGDHIHNTNPGHVGIGTTAPQASLHVSTSSGAAGSRGIIDEQTSNDANGALLIVRKSRAGAAVQNGDFIGNLYAQGFDGANWVNSSRLRFAVDGPVSAGSVPTAMQLLTGNTTPVERMRITSAGLVGVGTSDPLSHFHLHGSSPHLRISGSATDQHLTIGFYDNNSAFKGFVGYTGANGTGSRYTGIINATGDYLGLGTLNPAPVYFFLGGAQTHVMAANGNVGLGTTAPGHRLDVAGNVNASGGLCIAGTCKTAWSEVSSQWTTSGSNVFFNTGNVGIGTGAPAFLLDVAGSTNTPFRVRDSSGREYFSTTTRTGSVAAWTTPVVSLAGGRLIVESNVPEGGNESVIRRFVNNLIFNPSDHPSLPGAFIVRQVGGATGLIVDQHANGNVGIGTDAPTEKLHVVGNINVTGNINAKYQDVAEWVPSTQSLAAGTVVVLDTTRSNHVVASSTAYDTRVAGVISAQPGVLLGEGGEGRLMVATTGRVRVRVDATRGPVRVGDLLVTSDREGLAMKSVPALVGGRPMHLPGTLIGKALEPLESGEREILVLLSLQ